MACLSNRSGSGSAAAVLAAAALALGPVSAADLEYAIISPARVMIGKNVRVEGAIGTRFGVIAGEMDAADGDPLVMRSDFEHLDTALDTTLEILHAQVVTFDVNGDNRLRIDHPIESAGLAGFPELTDYDGNGDVDDFDLFLRHYDADGDGRVTYPARSVAGMLTARAPEFTGIDDRLARLIDTARPDRDGNGRITYADRERPPRGHAHQTRPDQPIRDPSRSFPLACDPGYDFPTPRSPEIRSVRVKRGLASPRACTASLRANVRL